MNALLVIGLGLIVYTYVGFPLLLMVRGRFTARPVKREPITPRVSIVIVAHNEADTIASKLENVDVLDYPSEQIEVIVASDGSDDGTNERVAAVQRPGLRLPGPARSRR
jgi:cellulose synthase/poly-beta-1,6-N-acetylglucosamine synthase-like glycosyltransferase